MARRGDDRGETLVELLVTIVVMSITVVALVGAIGVGVRISDIHRKQAVVGDYLREFAERVETGVSAGNYTACSSGGTPVTTYRAMYTLPVGAAYSRDVTQVALWNDTTKAFVNCPATGDAGVQRVTLRVWSNDNRASETLDIVIRKPCRAGETCT